MTKKEEKKQFGQFFTKNSDYILSGFESFINGKDLADPFAGGGDLIEWAEKNKAKKISGYDVDKKYVDNRKIFFNDSIANPKKYKFVITNPPYLNVNKANDKIKTQYFKNSGFEDLYQLSLNSLMNSEEGIVIVPINFLSAENSKKTRHIFFSKFKIVRMNYFKQQVFPDTTYNVIAFYYRKKKNLFEDNFKVETSIFPENKKISIELKKEYDWAIGGEILKLVDDQKNYLGIYRLTEKDIISGNRKIKAAINHVKNIEEVGVSEDLYKTINSNIILLKAIDSGSEHGKIALENIRKYGLDCLISKKSSRHMIYLVFDKKISLKQQEKLVEIFNLEINKLRDDYLSLFLTNYRDNDRKRIGFDFVYKFINYLYLNNFEYDKKQPALL
ncbi:MAG: hypothetical protein COX29_03260 [Candidatus Moranbacteria bacterium CG23_combo_of_CG06-09_8_20_14_all_35_22]|nr:MAG: hypothetical protein COX29_03260 [Candidatus Moranbacteria bacterium CG23_combo_of_CG06-09_8_20_14_all_35_22]